MKVAIKIILFVCVPIFLLMGGMYLCLWSIFPSSKQREIQETERIFQSIEKAKQTGVLEIYPPFWHSTPEFYANKQWSMLKGQTGIRSLYFCGYPGIPVAKNAIENLSTMSDLESIYLQNITFEKDALTGIYDLPNLRELTLSGCYFESAALKHLAALTQIETLKITCPMYGFLSHEPAHTIEKEEQRKIVKSLGHFTHLKKLILQECFRSDEETLRHNLPDTEIEFINAGYDIP